MESMENLDEQMRKLKLPNGQSGSRSQQTIVQNEHIDPPGNGRGAASFTMKKVGPLVPPKPVKKKTIQANIPTYNTKVEAFYESGGCDGSARGNTPTGAPRTIDIVSGGASAGLCRPPILLQRKHAIYGSLANGYEDNGLGTKVTLDNPIILDQQLEALAHHKKQLEKKGLLQQPQSISGQQHQHAPSVIAAGCNNISEIPKLSSISLAKNLNGDGSHAAYAIPSSKLSQSTAAQQPGDIFKPLQKQQPNFVYTNIPLNMYMSNAQQQEKQEKQAQIYKNINFMNAMGDHLGVALADAALGTNTKQLTHQKDGNAITSVHIADMPSCYSRTEITDADDDVVDDDILQPPSPVSSSYSELRRATTNTKANNTGSFKANQAQPISSSRSPTQHNKMERPTGMHQHQQQSQQHCCKKAVEHQHKEPLQSYLLDDRANAKELAAPSTVSGNRVQTYSNMNYNNDYNNTYCPTLQVRQSQNSTDYYGYASFSQGTSTYESIYEPINPRSSSQLSFTRSGNSLMYTSGYLNEPALANDPAVVGEEGGIPENRSIMEQANSVSSTDGVYMHQQQRNEAEVEALTDFLVKSMHQNLDDDEICSNQDTESYGICYNCNCRILGETSGCTAMDQTYHITCFTCSQCQINLQGKPFYALDAKPYCEYDYLQTLEKCSVCQKPILERILRATGKPYHPQCFTCVVCNKSLDGIPFTVDATNQNYCIIDFHKKFAPRCCVCKEPIMPAAGEEETVRVVALDRSFHFGCYKCEDCCLLLSSEAEGRGCYPLDDHVLCKSCNANRVQMLTSRMTTEL